MLQLSDPLGQVVVSENYLLAILAGQRLTSSLVVDAIGSTVDQNGSSKLLGGEADLVWLRALRSRVNLVVTGGATYRAEQYRMPRSADLAVFSRSPLVAPSGFEDSPRFLSFLGEQQSLSGEILQLMNKYQHIHLEFGAQTLIPILRQLGFGIWISSQFKSGIEAFCLENGMRQRHAIKVKDLHIAYCL